MSGITEVDAQLQENDSISKSETGIAYFTKTNLKRFNLVMLCTLAFTIYHLDSISNIQIRCTWGYTDEEIKLQQSLKEAMSQLETLKEQHNDLIAQVHNSPRFLNNSDHLLLPLSPGPLVDGRGSIEIYEKLRRRIYLNTKDMLRYLYLKLLTALYEDLKPKEKRALLEEVAEKKRSLLSDLEKLFELDGYSNWRREEAASVSDLVQRRLLYLQNPTDCRRAKKLLCTMDSCGFGCQHHHIVYCLIFAYATKRTLIFKTRSRVWRSNKRGWEHDFFPISNTCNSTYNNRVWKIKERMNGRVLGLYPLRYVMDKPGMPDYLPHHIPEDLAKRVRRFNGDPASWWVGQMIKYILKPQKHIQAIIDNTIAEMAFKSPVVGVHVRRTDKVGTEAAFYDVGEYMTHVAEYFAQIELTRVVDERRVYLATDDPGVLKEAVSKYSQYKFFDTRSNAELANISTRTSSEALIGFLIDLHMLSMCDYVVCTLSSNVCRLVLEMMQINRVDASTSVHTLDYVYYFTTTEPYYRMAAMRNSDELRTVDFDIGDIIKIKDWYAYNNQAGTVIRTNITGPIPWYKTNRHYLLRSFPEYEKVPMFPPLYNYTL